MRISSAKETRKTPNAAGRSSSTSVSGGVGSVGRGRPPETGPDGRDSVVREVERPGGGDRSHDHEERSRKEREKTAEEQQGGERDDAERDRGTAHIAELASHLRQTLQRLRRLDRDPEQQLAELRDDEHRRDSVQVADQHRAER